MFHIVNHFVLNRKIHKHLQNVIYETYKHVKM